MNSPDTCLHTSCLTDSRESEVLFDEPEQDTALPFPELTVPWMELIRNREMVSYKSKNKLFKKKVQQFEYHNAINLRNKLYETILWELLRMYIQEKGGTFYFASRHDDIFHGVDYIASLDNIHYIGIDLCVTPWLGNFGDIRYHPTVGRKITHFHERNIIPEEFVNTVRKGDEINPIPLIILQIDKTTLDALIQDFFTAYGNFEEKDLKTNMLEYYKEWILRKESVSDRVADILWLQKEEGTKEEYAQMMDIIRGFSELLEGESEVFIRTGSYNYMKK